MASSGQVSLRRLQEWFGHTRIATTEIYADFMPAEDEAALVDAAFERRSLRAVQPTAVGGPIRDQSEGN